MQSAIIINFAAWRHSQTTLAESPQNNSSTCSDELSQAIQMLIEELRKNMPCIG